jgi:hypothetical protein
MSLPKTDGHPSSARRAHGLIRPADYAGEVLRGAREIAAYYPGDSEQFRKIYQWAAAGRFPFFTEGSAVICARKSSIDKWIRLQELYALLGKKWGPAEVRAHFGDATARSFEDNGEEQ